MITRIAHVLLVSYGNDFIFHSVFEQHGVSKNWHQAIVLEKLNKSSRHDSHSKLDRINPRLILRVILLDVTWLDLLCFKRVTVDEKYFSDRIDNDFESHLELQEILKRCLFVFVFKDRLFFVIFGLSLN